MARRDIIASHFREPKRFNDAIGLETLGIAPAPVTDPVPAEPPQTIRVESDDTTEAFEIPIHEED